jgi:hypothetical protein
MFVGQTQKNMKSVFRSDVRPFLGVPLLRFGYEIRWCFAVAHAPQSHALCAEIERWRRFRFRTHGKFHSFFLVGFHAFAKASLAAAAAVRAAAAAVAAAAASPAAAVAVRTAAAASSQLAATSSS